MAYMWRIKGVFLKYRFSGSEFKVKKWTRYEFGLGQGFQDYRLGASPNWPPARRGHRCLPSLRAVGSTSRKPACKPPAYKPRAGLRLVAARSYASERSGPGGNAEKKMKSIGEGETGGSGDGVRGKGGHRGIGKRRR
jgi:hypothetical protein